MRQNNSILAYAAMVLLIAIAAFLAGRDSAVISQSSDLAKRTSEQRSIIADTIIEDECAALTDAEQQDCITDAVKASLEYRIATIDLNAQQRMAKYAGWALIVAAVGSVVAGLGIVFVARTLKATKDAVKDENRAYVQVDEAELRWGNDRASRIQITLTALNSGQTPAVHFSVSALCLVVENRISEFDIQQARVELDQIESSRWYGFAANRSQSFPAIYRMEDYDNLHAAFSLAKEKKSLEDDSIRIRIFGKITYKTFFDELFESEFLFEGLTFPIYRKVSDDVILERYDDFGIRRRVTAPVEEPWKLSKNSATELRIFQKLHEFNSLRER